MKITVVNIVPGPHGYYFADITVNKKKIKLFIQGIPSQENVKDALKDHIEQTKRQEELRQKETALVGQSFEVEL